MSKAYSAEGSFSFATQGLLASAIIPKAYSAEGSFSSNAGAMSCNGTFCGCTCAVLSLMRRSGGLSFTSLLKALPLNAPSVTVSCLGSSLGPRRTWTVTTSPGLYLSICCLCVYACECLCVRLFFHCISWYIGKHTFTEHRQQLQSKHLTGPFCKTAK